MVEMLAQTGCVAMLTLPENKGKLGFFGGIKEAKFRRQVVPGDILRLETEIIKIKGPVGVGKGIATVNGEKAVSAEITFAIK
jgi:3-hydroxyacyl-[acyl-carrier-protein] dehydratase